MFIKFENTVPIGKETGKFLTSSVCDRLGRGIASRQLGGLSFGMVCNE